MEIDRYSDVPPWRQLADELRRQITSGEIPPHRPIPSKKTLTQTYGVAGATVLGDGRVTLILDVPGIIALAGEREPAAA